MFGDDESVVFIAMDFSLNCRVSMCVKEVIIQVKVHKIMAESKTDNVMYLKSCC